MAAMNERPTEDLRCPICGKGVLRDIAYDENPAEPNGIKQAPDA